MKFIEPKVEIWEQNLIEDIDKDAILANLWAHIARCTRVCYQSEKKDCTETEEEFVKRVILRHTPWNSEANHLAMLEHGTVYLMCKHDDLGRATLVSHYNNNKYSKINGIFNKTRDIDGYCVTTNLRVLVENGWLDDLQYICSPTEYHAKRVTASFITNIGVTREFNRHRVNSIAEESTRYCNYSIDKFNKQLKIGLPAWLLNEESLPYVKNHSFDTISSYLDYMIDKTDEELLEEWCDIDFYLAALTFAEWFYMMLINKGWKPQQAREVLPLATKTQLIHTAFIDDWKHFIALRSDGVSGKPHPNAKILADKLKELLVL